MSILDLIAGKQVTALDVAKAGGAGAKDASNLATSALSRRVKQAELDEWLEAKPTRKATRAAKTMEAEEFVGEPAQETRRTERKLRKEKAKGDIKKLPSEVALSIHSTMNKMHILDQEDIFARTATLHENSTQEEYAAIYKDLPTPYKDNLGLTGKFSDDALKISTVQNAAINNLGHTRAMQLARAKAKGKSTGKFKTPPKPYFIKDFESVVQYLEQDQEIGNLSPTFSFTTDADELSAIANNVHLRANGLLAKDHQKAVSAADSNQHYAMMTPEEALEKSAFVEKALLHDAKADDLEFLRPEKAQVQYQTWSRNTIPVLEKQIKNFHRKTGQQKNTYIQKAYEAYMTERYLRKITNVKESNAYGK